MLQILKRSILCVSLSLLILISLAVTVIYNSQELLQLLYYSLHQEFKCSFQIFSSIMIHLDDSALEILPLT